MINHKYSPTIKLFGSKIRHNAVTSKLSLCAIQRWHFLWSFGDSSYIDINLQVIPSGNNNTGNYNNFI